MGHVTTMGVILLAFILGFRHGIDWDHITAIVDLVGSEPCRRRGFILTLWYAAGHETVIVVLGALAVLVGYTLPPSVDVVMERFVGVTLLILAALFVVSLVRGRGSVHVPMSRWRIIVYGFYNAFGWIAEKIDGRRRRKALDSQLRVGWKGAFGIGIIHGIGAETPTQILLFITASGLGSASEGMASVMSFVIGLLISHISLALTALVGYVNASRHGRVVRFVSYVTIAYSLVIGGIFTLGRAGTLPTLL